MQWQKKKKISVCPDDTESIYICIQWQKKRKISACPDDTESIYLYAVAKEKED